MNRQRIKMTAKPLVPVDARPDELAALEAFMGAAASVREKGGTLTARIINSLDRERRAVVWHVHSIVSDYASALSNAIVGTWDCRERVLTAGGETPKYCRTPADALAALLAVLAKRRAHRVKLHGPKPKKHRPSTHTVREVRRASFVSTGRVNNKHVPDEGNR